jgi:hypothetical protein
MAGGFVYSFSDTPPSVKPMKPMNPMNESGVGGKAPLSVIGSKSFLLFYCAGVC